MSNGPATRSTGIVTTGSRQKPGLLAILAAGLLLAIVLTTLSVQLLRRAGSGWSNDVVFDDGLGPRMDVRLQYKAVPDAGPTLAARRLLFRVKSVSGTPMRVDHVHYVVVRKGAAPGPAQEANPAGEFPANAVTGIGDGHYEGFASLDSPGEYEVKLEVQHGSDKFTASWPL